VNDVKQRFPSDAAETADAEQDSKMGILRATLYCAVAPATARALNCVEHTARPVLEKVWDVADRVAMGDEVPATSSVTVVVEPGSEDQVRSDTEEEAVGKLDMPVIFSGSGSW
jgi:hypothetical protein